MKLHCCDIWGVKLRVAHIPQEKMDQLSKGRQIPKMKEFSPIQDIFQYIFRLFLHSEHGCVCNFILLVSVPRSSRMVVQLPYCTLDRNVCVWISATNIPVLSSVFTKMVMVPRSTIATNRLSKGTTSFKKLVTTSKETVHSSKSRKSTLRIYRELCTNNQKDPVKATVAELEDLFIYLQCT